MAKRSGVGWLIAGVTLLFGGVALAATSSSKAGPSPSGDKDGDQTGRGKQEDKAKSESPGSDDDTPHAKGFRRALLAFAQKTKAAADEAARLGQDQKESGQVAAAASCESVGLEGSGGTGQRLRSGNQGRTRQTRLRGCSPKCDDGQESVS